MKPWSPEWKQAALNELYQEWENCQRCLLSDTRKNVVFGEGNPDADIMFVGEAPGEEEDKEGSPFVGRSGGLLRAMWEEFLSEKWEDVYVTNIVGCRPPENRNPLAAEKSSCLPRVHEIVYIVDPLIIVAVGKFALNALAGGRVWGVEKEHGSLFSSPHASLRLAGEKNGAEIPGRVFPRKGEDKKVYRLEYDLVPIWHPSYVLRFDSLDPSSGTFSEGGSAHQTLDDLQAVIDRIKQLHAEYARIPRILERTNA